MLYLVYKKNPYFKKGTFVEQFDHGCMQAKIEQKGHRVRVTGHTGMALPYDTVRPFLLKILKHGVDLGVSRSDRIKKGYQERPSDSDFIID